MLGGTQSLHTNSRDEALALPTEEAVRIALRTQQIIAYESGVAETVDPLAGSYYIESLTDRIEKEALQYLKHIDDLGGAVKAIEQGYIQKEIQDSAYQWQMDVEKGERIIVGLNKFQIEEKPPKGLLRVDPAVGERQKERLSALRARRNNNMVISALASLRNTARGTENLMFPILDAVRAYATLGEICEVLREEFGEYQPNVMF